MLKHRFLGSVPRDADFIDKAEELAFPSNSQVTLSHALHSTEPEELAPVSGTLFTTWEDTKTSWLFLIWKMELIS